MKEALNPDNIDRTVLLSMHDGSQLSLVAAIEARNNTGIVLCADQATCCEVNGQAALMTAVVTSVRAFGTVLVVVASPAANILRGVHRGKNLVEVISGEGARVNSYGELISPSHEWPVLLIGSRTPTPTMIEGCEAQSSVTLRATWQGWSAVVDSSTATDKRSIINNCILAPIAAAALGVSEAFGSMRKVPGNDAGFRRVCLNLRSPGNEVDNFETDRLFAPNAWWLVGLGHLGQAYSWVISWLGYTDPSVVELVLQDTDRTVRANHSTGVLTPKGSEGRPKTRLVAEALEDAGFKTRIIERRLGGDLRVTDAEMHHVALLGVDNLVTRQLISNVGWCHAIDVGLGTGATNFDSILLRRFPGRLTSNQIRGWISDDVAPIRIPGTQAFEDLRKEFEECGVIEVAGKAVGASFVGIVAATIAISQTMCEYLGVGGAEILRLDLSSIYLESDPCVIPADIIGIPLSA